MDEWIDSVTSFDDNFRAFILSGHLDHPVFDVDVVMQVLLEKLKIIYK